MYRILFLFLIFAVAPTLAFAEVRVVATLPALGALAKEIGGPDVTVETLARYTEDPHFVSPRPDFVIKVNRADLLIYNGMELEIGWLPPVQKNARNAKVLDGGSGLLDASRVIRPLQVPTGRVDRAQGDIHAQGNPHYLYALPGGIAVARAIAERLSAIDPDNAAHYAQRLDAFLQKADAENRYWLSRFAALPAERRAVVSYHDSMIYLIDWLGLTQKGTIEPIPGVAPGPSHVTALVSKLKADPASIILQENYQPRSTSDKIAKILGIRLLVIQPGPAPDQTYLDYVHKTLEGFF